LADHKVRGDPNQILQTIEKYEAFGVSDGLFKKGQGTAAWIVEGSNANSRIVGSMATPAGNTANHSLFCTEATGIYGLLLTVHLLNTNKSTKGTLCIICNGNLVIQRLNAKQPIDPVIAHANLLQASLNIIENLPFKIRIEHAKGHQDTKFSTVLTKSSMAQH